MVAWGPIIGAGISALGSLFGGKDEEKTETTIDYEKMARSAEKAGFNPLTAIRNGGSAGFTTTIHPGLSMSDRFGQAFQTIGNALASYDARADERADLELRIQRAELDRIQQQNSAAMEGRRWSFDGPHAAGSTRSGSAAANGGSGAGYYSTTDLGKTAKPEGEPVTELDDLVLSTQQVVTGIKDAWKGDPIHKWWQRVFTEGPRASNPFNSPAPKKGPSRPYTFVKPPPASGARPYTFGGY